jgi:hypothetical protein
MSTIDCSHTALCNVEIMWSFNIAGNEQGFMQVGN